MVKNDLDIFTASVKILLGQKERKAENGGYKRDFITVKLGEINNREILKCIIIMLRGEQIEMPLSSIFKNHEKKSKGNTQKI